MATTDLDQVVFEIINDYVTGDLGWPPTKPFTSWRVAQEATRRRGRTTSVGAVDGTLRRWVACGALVMTTVRPRAIVDWTDAARRDGVHELMTRHRIELLREARMKARKALKD